MMSSLRICLGLACSISSLACGEKATEEEGTGGTSGTGGTGGTGGTACNTVTNTAATVEVMGVAQALPASEAMGGTILPGTYHFTSRTVYTGPGGATGPSGETRRQTLLISLGSSGTFVVESVLSNDGGPDEHVSLSTMLSGTQATINVTCPQQAPLSVGPFTATPTSFESYDTVDGQVDVFTRQ